MGNPENIEKSEVVVPIVSDKRLPSKAIAFIGFSVAFLAIGAGVGIALIRSIIKKAYYPLDQKIDQFNLDSAQAGFGAEQDIEETPEDLSLPDNVPVEKSKPIGSFKKPKQDNRYPPANDSRYPPSDSRYPAKNSNRNYNTASGYPQPNLQVTATGLKCWHCEADSYELCSATGYEEICHSNEERCELVIRQRQGYITQIHMGCKQQVACENNKRQNFQNSNPAYTQCRPEAGYTHSVCRQCCSTDNCTKEPNWWYPASRAEWAAQV